MPVVTATMTTEAFTYDGPEDMSSLRVWAFHLEHDIQEIVGPEVELMFWVAELDDGVMVATEVHDAKDGHRISRSGVVVRVGDTVRITEEPKPEIMREGEWIIQPKS